MQSLSIEPCKPPQWALGGHQQTILGFLLPSEKLRQTGSPFLVSLKDGDQLLGKLHYGTNDILVVAFHGLTGSIDSIYMQLTAIEALKLGCSVLLMNHRGCGEGKGLAKHPYHSGRGEDVSDVIEALRARFSQKKIIAVGFSLGANALLTLMTGQRGVCLPDGALAFNGPVDLLSCSEKLKQGLNRIYDFEFVRLCRKDIQDRQSMGLSKKNYQIPWFYRLQDIDRIYTAEAAGFISAHHYYRTCSTYQHFKSISKPTILITSKDDPFITWEPYLNALANPVIRLHIEEHGGHLGYLTTHSQGFVHERWLRQALRVALSELTFDL